MNPLKLVLLLFISYMSLWQEAYAQNTFLKYLRYGNPESNCQGWSIKETSNGNIITQFRYKDDFSAGLDFGFFTLNKFGDSLSTNVYHLPGDDFVEHIHVENNNTIYATGCRLANGASTYDAIIYKINLLDSSKNYYKHYSNSEGNWVANKILKKSNKLYITTYKNSINYLNNYNLIKSDLDGNILFDSSFVAFKSDNPNSSTFDNQGNILITGGSFSGSINQPRILTMKVDTNGQELWRTFNGISGDIKNDCRAIGRATIQLPNSDLYITGYTNNGCDINTANRGRNNSILIKLDSNGNHLWTIKERFSNYWEQAYFYIYKTFDGNLICVGSVNNILDSSTLILNYDLLITKYDVNGNVIWYRVYGLPNYHEYIYNSSQAKDGGILITGRFENILNPFHDVQTYVLKVDDCGCLVPGCDPNCIASGTNSTLKINQLKLFPNPATNTLKLETELNFEKYSILNLLGEIQLENSYSSSIDISNLHNGMYLLQLKTKSNTSTFKFIKE